MKAFTIFLILLAVVIGLLGFGLQTFLTKGLTAALNDTILPAVESEYGLVVSVENATINLLQGQAEVDGLSMHNLPGYTKSELLRVESFRLKLDLLSLLKRDPIIIRSAKAMGLQLNVERNAQGNINVQELAKKFQTLEKPIGESLEEMTKDLPTEEKISVAVAGAPTQFPIHIRRVIIDGIVAYSDAKLQLELPLDLRLTGSDLFSVPAKDQPDSLLVLRGAMQDDPSLFTTDLNAILKPLVDPARPSFNATGSILNIDAVLLQNLLEKNDMASGPFSVRPSIVCKQAQLKGSVLNLAVDDLILYGSNIGDTTLKIPLYGTLDQPLPDLTGALQSLFSKQSAKIISAIGARELQKRSDSTNAPSDQNLSDLLIDELGKSVKEIDQNTELKDSLRKFGDSLFGN